jgi:hypothetical protein
MPNFSNMQAIAAEWGLVDVGPGGDGDDTYLPAKLAWRVLPAIELKAKLAAAVLHVAQTHAVQTYAARDKQAVEAMGRITEEIIDDLCPPPLRIPQLRWPPPPPPWPWVLQQLGELAERYPAGSLLRAAAFDLAQRVVARARDTARPLDRSLATELAEQVALREAK